MVAWSDEKMAEGSAGYLVDVTVELKAKKGI
jgi:hypothetical protein